jgi:hypothetical protein
MPLLIETNILMTGHFAKYGITRCGMITLRDGRIILRSDR